MAVANIGAVCTMHCGWGSIICPVPFPSRLIMPHTSTAAVVVNNTTTLRDRHGGHSHDCRSLRRSSRSTAHKSTDCTSSPRYKILCRYSAILKQWSWVESRWALSLRPKTNQRNLHCGYLFTPLRLFSTRKSSRLHATKQWSCVRRRPSFSLICDSHLEYSCPAVSPPAVDRLATLTGMLCGRTLKIWKKS